MSSGRTTQLSQAEYLRQVKARQAQQQGAAAGDHESSLPEEIEDTILFQVHYLEGVQGGKHVVGRDFAFLASAPETRRTFLCTAKRVLLGVLKPGAELSVENLQDLLTLLCRDWPQRVTKSAFKAAWVVLRERPRTHHPRLPFDKFWRCLELTWLYEEYFLTLRRHAFDSDSHRVMPSSGVRTDGREVEQHVRQDGWSVVPMDILKEAIARASSVGDRASCHFDGLVKALCVSERMRAHIKMENAAAMSIAHAAAAAAAKAWAEKRAVQKLEKAMARQALLDSPLGTPMSVGTPSSLKGKDSLLAADAPIPVVSDTRGLFSGGAILSTTTADSVSSIQIENVSPSGKHLPFIRTSVAVACRHVDSTASMSSTSGASTSEIQPCDSE